jgi:hypothetical protein
VLQRTLDPDFVARVRACVVPDGVFVFVGDAVLDGAPTRAAPVPMQIEHDLLARAGLQACATVRTAVDADVLEACIDRSAPPERRPQLCTARDGRLSTSFVVAARVRAPAAVRAAPPAVLVPALPPQPATLRVAVDLRTVAYADSSARGIGQYTVHHLAAVARRDATVQLCCHLPDAIALPRQLELPNVTRRDVDAFAARDCDVVHLPDPMNLTLGFDSPLRTFRHERTTVTFHDLTPLRHYLQAWPERNRLAYLDRLRQIERSDALLLCNSTFTRRRSASPRAARA